MKALGLGLRFALEMFVLVTVGVFAWQSLAGGVFAWIGAIGIPLVLVAMWGTFAVPGDPSRGGGPPVPVSGAMRILVEMVFFGAGLFATANMASIYATVGVGLAIVVQYVLGADRLRWLLAQPRPRRL